MIRYCGEVEVCINERLFERLAAHDAVGVVQMDHRCLGEGGQQLVGGLRRERRRLSRLLPVGMDLVCARDAAVVKTIPAVPACAIAAHLRQLWPPVAELG